MPGGFEGVYGFKFWGWGVLGPYNTIGFIVFKEMLPKPLGTSTVYS